MERTVQTSAASDESPKTMLSVDDQPANLRVLVDCLERQGHQVLVALGGEEAIQRAEFVRPDLILLDVHMRGIDGFETCRRLKANPSTRDIPVIFMTVLADTADKLAGFAAGGVDYVTKPLDAAEVLARIDTHLALSTLAVERCLHLRQAADRHAGGFTAVARDLHAGDALQRVAHAEVGQLLDVVGDDRIHDALALALVLLGRRQAGALAGDDDGGGRRRLRCVFCPRCTKKGHAPPGALQDAGRELHGGRPLPGAIVDARAARWRRRPPLGAQAPSQT